MHDEVKDILRTNNPKNNSSNFKIGIFEITKNLLFIKLRCRYSMMAPFIMTAY